MLFILYKIKNNNYINKKQQIQFIIFKFLYILI